MNNDQDHPTPTEPPIAWRCSWTIEAEFLGGFRPKPTHRDFATKEAAEQFKRQLKSDFPNTVASVVPVYFNAVARQQRGSR